MVVFVLPQLTEIFEVKIRSPNFTLFFFIKQAIFNDFWLWPQIFLIVVATQIQSIWHFKPLIVGFQILGGQVYSNPFCIIFSCFKNGILLYVYYMRYVIIRDTLYKVFCYFTSQFSQKIIFKVLPPNHLVFFCQIFLN